MKAIIKMLIYKNWGITDKIVANFVVRFTCLCMYDESSMNIEKMYLKALDLVSASSKKRVTFLFNVYKHFLRIFFLHKNCLYCISVADVYCVCGFRWLVVGCAWVRQSTSMRCRRHRHHQSLVVVACTSQQTARFAPGWRIYTFPARHGFLLFAEISLTWSCCAQAAVTVRTLLMNWPVNWAVAARSDWWPTERPVLICTVYHGHDTLFSVTSVEKFGGSVAVEVRTCLQSGIHGWRVTG